MRDKGLFLLHRFHINEEKSWAWQRSTCGALSEIAAWMSDSRLSYVCRDSANKPSAIAFVDPWLV